MKYEKLKKQKRAYFKRYVGVHIETFDEMVQVLQEQEKKEIKEGKNSQLSLEDQILITLQHLKEGRSFFHLGFEWKIDEKEVICIVKKVEKILLKSGKFRLPRKKFKVFKN